MATGSLRGAVFGALSGMAAAGIGQYFKGMEGWMVEVKRGLAHGVSQGALAEAQGGRFGAGLLAGSFGSLASHAAPDMGTANLIKSAVIGGTASTIGGGKFENGAVTAAFTHLFNEGLAGSRDEVRIAQRTEVREIATFSEHIQIEIRSFNGNLEASRDLYEAYKLLSTASDVMTVAEVLIRGPRPETLYGFSLSKTGDMIAGTFVAASDKSNTYYPYSVTVHYRLDMIMHTGKTFVLYERSYRVPSPYSSPKDHHYGLKAALRASQRGVEYHRRQTGSTWND